MSDFDEEERKNTLATINNLVALLLDAVKFQGPNVAIHAVLVASRYMAIRGMTEWGMSEDHYEGVVEVSKALVEEYLEYNVPQVYSDHYQESTLPYEDEDEPDHYQESTLPYEDEPDPLTTDQLAYLSNVFDYKGEA